MKVHHSLICLFFFLSLQDGNTGLVNSRIPVFSGIEGQYVRVQYSFSSGGSRMFLCKGTCEENTLIDTTVDRAQRGRFSIEFKDTYPRSTISVTIRNLMKSDSGLYRCGFGEPGKSPYEQVEVIVVDAVLQRNPPREETLYTRTGGNIVVQCFFRHIGSKTYLCKDHCEEEKDILVHTSGDKVQNGSYSIESIDPFVYVSITQLNQSDSGRYSCAADGFSSPIAYREFKIMVTDGSATSGPDLILPVSPTSVSTPQCSDVVLLYLVVILAIIVIVLGLVLLITCVWRNNDPDAMRTVLQSLCLRRPT